ncbi:discoidin domain-containing protein [Streptomyces sp. GbtcB6]|uniref:discoidin domain-containing protein n=1 Tax=Streptomyces sp. GbtcB6 TaxID=2824751 RepID=UPI001C2F9009|nr:discoidin domain-containing protein [Streptomyces sp. GbtcB6]
MARTCDQCGAAAQSGDDFCGVCGAFMEWDAPHEAADAPTTPSGTSPDLAPPDLAPPGRPAPPEPAAQASPPSVGPGTVAVQPGRATPPRPAVAVPVEDDHVTRPDDVDCAACGTANPAERAFCRRCGAPLTQDSPATTVSWWRRWWQKWRRRRVSRRRRRSRLRRLVSVLLTSAVSAAAVWAGITFGPSAVSALRNRFTAPVPVHAVSVRASGSVSGHPPKDAVDGVRNSYWAPATSRTRKPDGTWFEADFDQPFRLARILISSGASANQNEFLGQARPAALEITAWVTAGVPVHRTVHLDDEPAPQTVRIPVVGVTKIRLTLRSAYGTARDRQVAIGEVEFFEQP